jgi:DNA mismatch repair protein MutS
VTLTLAESTPLLLQYREIKSRHRDAILFFRMGDFYEMFFEDAQLGARALSITLTSRGDGVPLAGVPVKAAAEYIRQLVSQGHRVAICEQVEDPRKAKGIVRREVVETVTPGALLEEGWIAGGRNNWIVAVWPAGGQAVTAAQPHRHTARPPLCHTGLAAIDLSTGEFFLECVEAEGLGEALGRLNPAELVLPSDFETGAEPEVLRTRRESWEFDTELAREELARRFALASLDGLGLGDADAPADGAAGALHR